MDATKTVKSLPSNQRYENRRDTRRTHCEVKAAGHVILFHQQGVMFVNGCVKLCRPGLRQGAVGFTHHPVGLEDLMQVLSQAGAVVDDDSQLLYLQVKRACETGFKQA